MVARLVVAKICHFLQDFGNSGTARAGRRPSKHTMEYLSTKYLTTTYLTTEYLSAEYLTTECATTEYLTTKHLTTKKSV